MFASAIAAMSVGRWQEGADALWAALSTQLGSAWPGGWLRQALLGLPRLGYYQSDEALGYAKPHSAQSAVVGAASVVAVEGLVWVVWSVGVACLAMVAWVRADPIWPMWWLGLAWLGMARLAAPERNL